MARADPLERQLLKLVAAVPAGEKLPIGRFARELSSSQSVVMGLVSTLVRDGKLDGESLRPVPVGAPGQASARGDEALPSNPQPSALLAEVEAYLAATGMTKSAFGNCAAKNSCFVDQLRRGAHPTARVEARVRDFLAKNPNPWAAAAPLQADKIPAQPGSAPVPGADDEGAAAARFDPAAAPTGEDLYAALLAEAKRRGVALVEMCEPLWPGQAKWKLEQMRIARSPRPATVARIREFIGGGAVLPSAAKRDPAPRRPIVHQVNDNPDRRERIAVSERGAAQRRPGETLAAAIRRCGRELEAEENAEPGTVPPHKRRTFEPLPGETWAAISALAAEMGKGRRETLLDVVAAGITCVRAEFREELQ